MAMGRDSSNNADLGTSATLSITFTDVGGDVSLSVVASNTSDTTTGGFLTAFGFVMPSIDSIVSSVIDSDYSLVEFSSPQTLNEFGITLNVRAGTGGQYEGGGSPNDAIGIGESGTYSFLLDTTETAANLEALFFAQSENSAVRFRGLTNGGSDKLTNTTSPVPLPAAGWMLDGGACVALQRCVAAKSHKSNSKQNFRAAPLGAAFLFKLNQSIFPANGNTDRQPV